MNKKIIEYSLKYILMVIIINYINLVIGFLPNLYTVIILIPIINYLILLWGIIRPIDNDRIYKEDIYLPFLIITTVFNLMFFYMQSIYIINILVIAISNIIEFHLMKPKKEKIKDIADKNVI